MAIQHGRYYDECYKDGMEYNVHYNLLNLVTLDLADNVEDSSIFNY